MLKKTLYLMSALFVLLGSGVGFTESVSTTNSKDTCTCYKYKQAGTRIVITERLGSTSKTSCRKCIKWCEDMYSESSPLLEAYLNNKRCIAY